MTRMDNNKQLAMVERHVAGPPVFSSDVSSPWRARSVDARLENPVRISGNNAPIVCSTVAITRQLIRRQFRDKAWHHGRRSLNGSMFI